MYLHVPMAYKTPKTPSKYVRSYPVRLCNDEKCRSAYINLKVFAFTFKVPACTYIQPPMTCTYLYLHALRGQTKVCEHTCTV